MRLPSLNQRLRTINQTHTHTHLRTRSRLVAEEHVRSLHDAAAQRQSPLLPAAQAPHHDPARQPPAHMVVLLALQPRQADHLARPLQLGGERHVDLQAHMRVEEHGLQHSYGGVEGVL